MKKLVDRDSINFHHSASLDTGLHCVAKSSCSKKKSAAEFLIKKGADLNAKNKDLCAPMHLAVDNNSITVAECLIKHNAKINAIDQYGKKNSFQFETFFHIVWKGARMFCISGEAR